MSTNWTKGARWQEEVLRRTMHSQWVGVDIGRSPDNSVITVKQGDEVHHLKIEPDMTRVWFDGKEIYAKPR